MRTLRLPILLVLAATARAQELPRPDCSRILDHVLPDAAEDRWLEIPWQTTLREAVAEADAAERPMLLWMMNGHPLGHT